MQIGEWSFEDLDQEQGKSFDPKCLADDDSLFLDVCGFDIHHKICDGCGNLDQMRKKPRPELPMILLHGFGASVFSWGQVMKPLASITGSKVLAFDRPAFGLTSRKLAPEDLCLNPYSTAFSVNATQSFMDVLGTDKVTLIGHSAGCLVAANAYLAAPEKIAALILVAPAIPALFSHHNTLEENYSEERLNIEWGSNLQDPKKNVSRISDVLLTLLMILAWPSTQLLRGLKCMMFSLYKIILSACLRSSFAVALVRIIMVKFGVLIVKHGWYNKSNVTAEVIDGYTKPLKAKGWEMALLEYIRAILIDLIPGSKLPLIRRICDITCPVLIITGDSDRIVPPWNAKRLAATIPGSTLEVIKNCGHLPHEEKVEDFIEVVDKFLQARILKSKGTFCQQ